MMTMPIAPTVVPRRVSFEAVDMMTGVTGAPQPSSWERRMGREKVVWVEE